MFRTTLLFFLMAPFFLVAQKIDPEILKSMNIRNIGPAGMSGRINAIDVDLSNPEIIYAGAASGGVWKSTNGGINWSPIFDKESCQAIGAIAINQRNTSEIWVGTGEGNPRNSHNSGLGIFKSIDAGKSWQHMGLKDTRLIHRVRIDYHDPETVYVGAMGSAWGPNKERGVFKTTDGGKTWRNVLFVNDSTGCAELVMDPANPRKLIAAMWEYGRKPWTFTSGGKGSGLWITYNGGEHWTKITAKDGLPEGELGRIGLAIAPSKPTIVYALVEAKENAVYKSTDGGHKWSKVSTDNNAGNRPFYYAEIYVDPKNENRIFSLWTNLSRSEDGGRTWQNLLPFISFSGVHPDHHAFWVHPENTNYMIEGNDGGLNISHDGGASWRFADNIPVAQFYHIDHDLSIPYRIGGGMQDNGSWVGPSAVWQQGGIKNHHWKEVYFGDGFDVAFKPDNPALVYAMSQGGNMALIDVETGKNTFIKPLHPEGIELRFNWNTGLALMPMSDCGLYFGSQFLHKSTDCGKTWEIISPDLTNPDSTKIALSRKSGGLTPDVTAAENHHTILAIAPSPVDPNVIWVGTDDGNLQLTRDGGRSWSNLSAKLPGIHKGFWIPQIETSKTNAGEAFVVVNDYRRNDYRPYLFHTRDFGATWQRLVNEKQVEGHVWSVVQDPEVPDLLFLGTEHGLYFSIDYGMNWQKWSEDFPAVPVADMKIHPREGDLIVGTFGRSAWVLDNLSPLREIAKTKGKLLEKSFAAFQPQDAYLAEFRSVDGIRFIADGTFVGRNKSANVRVPIWNKPPEKRAAASDSNSKLPLEKQKPKDKNTAESPPEKEKGDGDEKSKEDRLKVQVLNAQNDTIRTFSVKLDTGLVYVFWGLERNGARFPTRNELKADADPPGGSRVLPGNYKLHFRFKEFTDSTIVSVLPDPRLPFELADMIAQENARLEFNRLVEKASNAFEQLKESKKTLKLVNDLLSNAPDSLKKDLVKQRKSLDSKIDSLMLLFVSPENEKGITRNPDHLNAKLFRAQSYINNSNGPPSQSAQIAISQAEKSARENFDQVNAFFEGTWKEFRQKIEGMKMELFKPVERL